MSSTIEDIKVSNQLRNLKKLCEKKGVKFFVAFQENVNGTPESYSEGDICPKTVSGILATSQAPKKPISDLPKLPVNYEALYKAGNQQAMLDHANLLMKKYVGTTPMGLGKLFKILFKENDDKLDFFFV